MKKLDHTQQDICHKINIVMTFSAFSTLTAMIFTQDTKDFSNNKTDRGAVKALHTVSAYSTENGLCLSQLGVGEKTNEIPAV
ncbi:MAG: hypothetical protein FWD96_06235, partial [Defluviitaleaceae bacterium]|nr:hypothetical protein [Defluviitaleaceae bacterium]